MKLSLRTDGAVEDDVVAFQGMHYARAGDLPRWGMTALLIVNLVFALVVALKVTFVH